MYENVIFREYDIRGVFLKHFDLDFAYELGKAYARFHFKKFNNPRARITIGHDARSSSPEIFKQLSKGLIESGFDVLYLGLVTSPISYFSTFEIEDVSGSIMITGSHNPPEYNGYKISVGNSTIFGDEIQELRKIIESKNYLEAKVSGDLSNYDILPKYCSRYSREFGSLAGVKVVLDCGNGAAGSVVKNLFKECDLNPTILFEQPDGNFPNHHPDPTVEENLVSLKEQVIKEGAVVGIGFDGDADRIGVVDHTGRMIYGDELMVIISRSILQKQKGAKIIGDVKCSDRLFKDIKNNGGEPIMWKTGHSLIKEKVKKENAPFGGEMSGHIFFADRNYGYDDALYAALRLIEIIKETGKTIPELLSGLPTAFNTPEIRLDTTEEKKLLIVEKLKARFSKPGNYEVNLLDGLRVSYPNGWALARASNTQPVLVLRYESNSKQDLEKIKSDFESLVQENI